MGMREFQSPKLVVWPQLSSQVRPQLSPLQVTLHVLPPQVPSHVPLVHEQVSPPPHAANSCRQSACLHVIVSLQVAEHDCEVLQPHVPSLHNDTSSPIVGSHDSKTLILARKSLARKASGDVLASDSLTD